MLQGLLCGVVGYLSYALRCSGGSSDFRAEIATPVVDILNCHSSSPADPSLKELTLTVRRRSKIDIDQRAPLSLLLIPGCSYTALHCAVYSNSVETVNLLIDKGANIEAGTNFENGTLLYLVSSLGNLPIVERLSSWNAYVNARGGSCGQPLQVACG